MKKSLLSIFAMATMLLATGCSQEDELVNGGENGELVEVTFNLKSGEGPQSRAISDGKKAKNLYCGVFDQQGNVIPTQHQQVVMQDPTVGTTVTFQLVKGQTYDFVFWAQTQDESTPQAEKYYNVNKDDLTEISVNYGTDANDEARDAFFANVLDYTVDGHFTKSVTLTRPFGQLNVGTTSDDYDLATTLLSDKAVKKSKLVVKNLPSTLNLLTGEVSAPVDNAVFNLAELPVDDDTQGAYETLSVDIDNDESTTDETFVHLSMNYLLASASSALHDVEIVFANEKNGEDNTINTLNVKNVPVQRNYRTNIIGTILTTTGEFKIVVDEEFDKPDYIINVNDVLKNILETIMTAVANGETNIVVDAMNLNIGALNAAFNTTLIPAGTTVTLKNAVVEGISYGNKVDGKIIFENCTFTHTGAYSIHFDGGSGEVEFKNCALYGWNSFGSTLEKVSFYDSRLYGNGTYALIRSYVELYLENCYINTLDAIQDDEWPEGVEAVNGATKTEKNCIYASKVEETVTDIEDGGTVSLTEDLVVSKNSNIHTQNLTESLTINGNNHTITSYAESIDDFQWEGGTIPAMSTIFSSVKSSNAKVTVNDLNFTGTMSALMLGHYVNSSSNWYNTELNNVNVIDTEVVSFSAGVSPAVCVYGTATLNKCEIYGTTLSPLDTDPMWPVYDLVAVNYTNVTINESQIGSLYMWNQAKVTIGNGTTVESIIIKGNMNITKYGLTIADGAKVESIDLSAIADKTKINITIESSATVGKIVANGVEYASLDEWKNA